MAFMQHARFSNALINDFCFVSHNMYMSCSHFFNDLKRVFKRWYLPRLRSYLEELVDICLFQTYNFIRAFNGTDMVELAQLVRALVCGTRGHGFDSHIPPHLSHIPLAVLPLDGVSPSGKARDFDSRTRRFKSCHPSHMVH